MQYLQYENLKKKKKNKCKYMERIRERCNNIGNILYRYKRR